MRKMSPRNHLWPVWEYKKGEGVEEREKVIQLSCLKVF